MPIYVYAITLVGTVLWFTAFVVNRWDFTRPQKLDRRARWGMVIQGISYAIPWQGHFRETSPGTARVVVAVMCFVLASALSWTSTKALGGHLRMDAGLNPDHELVQRGPYRIVRHPIYTSMLCVFLGMAVLVAPPLLFALAAIAFLAGTEIRVRIEDNLLASRFGEQFQNYRRNVRAYIPLLR